MICKCCGCMTGNDNDVCDDCKVKKASVQNTVSTEETEEISQLENANMLLNQINEHIRTLVSIAKFFVGLSVCGIVVAIIIALIPLCSK